MSLASNRWRAFADHGMVEDVLVRQRPKPRFDDFFSEADLAQLDLEVLPELKWSHEIVHVEGPEHTGAEFSGWVGRDGKWSSISLNPYKCLTLNQAAWRALLLHELSHLIAPSDPRTAPTGHDFPFAVTLAVCHYRLGQVPKLRAYDLSDVAAPERLSVLVHAEQLGRRIAESSEPIHRAQVVASLMEASANQVGWDKAMRPAKRFWIF